MPSLPIKAICWTSGSANWPCGRDGRPRIHRGCDLHLSFDNIDEVLQGLGGYSINGTQYLLVECPDFHVGKHTEKVLLRLLDSGIVPVVTHPERNPVLQDKLSRVEEWVELGCLVQVTALSIAGVSAARPAARRPGCWSEAWCM